MAQYTFTAFKWTGPGYNATYETSVKAVIDDDDKSYQGSGDSSEKISIDGGGFGGSTGDPYVIKVAFTDTAGKAHVEDFNFFNTGGNWYFVPSPGSSFTTGARLGSYQSHVNGWNYADVTCFVGGTMIATDRGPVPVEDLRAGTLVLTAAGGFRPLQLALRRTVAAPELCANPKLNPVCISAGALGNGLPERDLYVSRQHRMLVSSEIARRMFTSRRVLVAAIRLTELPGIRVVPAARDVDYFHLLFDAHEVIFAEGAPTESFYTGANALAALTQDARDEIAALFPDMLGSDHRPRPAHLVPTGKQQRRLVARHLRNQTGVLEVAGRV